MMFGKKKPAQLSYDKENETPAVKSSICTGEKTAGFREIRTGRFHEVMLIRTPNDLNAFREKYGITGDVKTIY